MRFKLTRRRKLLCVTVLLLWSVLGFWFYSWYFAFERRFARSIPELDKYAAQVIATGPTAPLTPPDYLGSFDVSEAFRLPHGFVFRSDYGHPFDWNGLAYSTEALPEEMPDTHPPYTTMFFKNIEGNWYTIWRN